MKLHPNFFTALSEKIQPLRQEKNPPKSLDHAVAEYKEILKQFIKSNK